MTTLTLQEERILYQQPGVYSCFPDLCILPDGRIGTTFFTRTARNHIDNTGGTASLISDDNGQSWNATTQPLYDKSWQRADGSLVCPFAESWIYVDAAQEARLREQHKTILQVRPGTIAYLGNARFKTSHDSGQSWQTHEIPVPDDCVGLIGYHAAASHLVTSDGIRLRAVYGRRLKADGSSAREHTEVFLLRSDDDGQNWSCFPMFPDGLESQGFGFDETTLEEASDGTLIALMRTNPAGHLWQSESMDGGLTWSPARQTPIWGFPAHLLRLRNGLLLCAYGHRREPMGIRACLSHDNGHSWDLENEIVLRQDGISIDDIGYPLLHELPDGRIFSVYYMTTEEENTHIASTIFELPVV